MSFRERVNCATCGKKMARHRKHAFTNCISCMAKGEFGS